MSLEKSGLSENVDQLIGGGKIDKAQNFGGWLEKEFCPRLSKYNDILNSIDLSNVFLNPAHSEIENLAYALTQEIPQRISSFKLYAGVISSDQITEQKKNQYLEKMKAFDVNIYGQVLFDQIDSYKSEDEEQLTRKKELKEIILELIEEVNKNQSHTS